MKEMGKKEHGTESDDLVEYFSELNRIERVNGVCDPTHSVIRFALACGNLNSPFLSIDFAFIALNAPQFQFKHIYVVSPMSMRHVLLLYCLKKGLNAINASF